MHNLSMRVALSLILVQDCCNPVLGKIHLSMGNVPGGVPIRIKHLLHSSAVRYGE